MEDKLNVLAPEVARVDELDKNNLRVVLEPFERGFGYTIGHSLRRIMLSYMPGAVQIKFCSSIVCLKCAMKYNC